MATDYVYDSVKGSFNDAPDPAEAAKSQLAKVMHLDLGAAGTAGSAGTESLGWPVGPKAIEILSVKLCNGTTAVTADNTNYATVNVYSRDEAGGGSAVPVAQANTTTTGTGSLASRQVVDVPIVAGKSRVAAGKCLTVNWTKAASGVATGTGIVMVRYREVGV